MPKAVKEKSAKKLSDISNVAKNPRSGKKKNDVPNERLIHTDLINIIRQMEVLQVHVDKLKTNTNLRSHDIESFKRVLSDARASFQSLFDAMMRLVISYCTEEHQALIVQKGYHVLMAKTFLYKELDASASMETIKLPPAANFLSLNDKWLVSLLASFIIALRPHVLLPEVQNILKITVWVLAGLEAAAQALGSMVSKWPVALNTDCVDACTLEEALKFIFEIIFHNGSWNSQMEKCVSLASIQENVRHFNIEGEFLVDAHAIVGVAWMAKGLVMRCHEKAKDMAMLLIDCLLSRVKGLTLEMGNDSIEDKSFATSICASDAFQIITCDSEISLNKTFHASIRPLYKQRFYLNMMPLISQANREHDYSVTKYVNHRRSVYMFLPAIYVNF